MYSWLIFASILLGFTANAQNVVAPQVFFGSCSYTGDPHLIPFPPSQGQVSNMYFCSTIGWQILLQNQWVLIAVQVGPSPYVILDYVVIFFKADSSLACILIGSLGLSTCPASSSVISFTYPGGTAWNHFYPTAQFFDLQISSYPWGSLTRYDFYIRESFNLIGQSTGLCVNFTCPLERNLQPPIPIIAEICTIYIKAGQKAAIIPVDETRVNLISTACQYDLAVASDLKFAQTAAVHIIYSSLDQLITDQYRSAVRKVGQSVRTALAEADAAAAEIIRKGDTCYDQQRCLTNGDL